MSIRILAPHEAAKIAAGEVIERPASVVKELVENSLDGGATRVDVEIRGGGLSLIRVADDGCGIEPHELRLAFERHATSKVQAEEDLWRVVTLGFRGEALPSIAAAGDVEVVTRIAGNDRGARIRLRGGEIADEGSAATSPGTVFTVRGLFSPQPARLKFLRGPGAESSQVASVVAHYALAYPEVRFSLAVDGRVTLQAPGNGSVIDAAAAVYGVDVAAGAIEIAECVIDSIGVHGVAMDPSVHRSTRNYIGLYVNRRWIKNRALTFAVEEAYQGMLPTGRHPVAIVGLTLPPEDVDVNVHPTKAEVRLRREREVFGALQRAIRAAIAVRAPVLSASASVWVRPEVGGPAPAFLRAQPAQASLAPAWPAPIAGDASVERAAGAPAAAMSERLPMLRAIGQVGTTYVVAEGPDGLYLVDQHAAHERVLYERFLAGARAGTPDVQGLLQPQTIELPAAHAALMTSHGDALARLGFDAEPFGDRAFVVRAVPSAMVDDVQARIVELLDRMQRDDGADDREHRAAASLACHASVRAGMTLSSEEQRELLRGLEGAATPRTCPHGRPTIVHLSADSLAREFRRK